MANRQEGVLQVAEEAEAEDQIELAEFADFRTLDVALIEKNLREAFTCLLDILDTAIESSDLESTLTKNLRKEANPASGVQRCREVKDRFQLVDHPANGLAARLNQLEVMPLVKYGLRGCGHFWLHFPMRIPTADSEYRSTHPYSA